MKKVNTLVECYNIIQLLTFVEGDTMIYQPQEGYIYRGRENIIFRRLINRCIDLNKGL